jgi:serine protease Do
MLGIRIGTAMALSLLLGAAPAPWAKESKEEARPKRGSLDLGKGKLPPSDGARIDMLNGLLSRVVEAVSPAVVSVTTEKKWSERPQQFNHPFFEFFGVPPEMQPPESQGPKRNIPLGGGSGFIVNKDGYVFTNAHVVDGADIVKVSLVDKKTFVAKVVGVDKKTDVAVLKINPKGQDLTVVAFGDSKAVTIGEWVLAIGNPFALQNTVTSGIVSAKGRREPMSGDSYADFIQTDAAVNPGNSGGPLVNLRGEVIGINSSIYTRTGGYMGVSFAIPIDMALKVAEDIIYEGKVTRGYLGIGIDNVSENLADAMGLQGSGGCLVREVMKSSPAAKGGLKEGDIILKVGDSRILDAADLRNKVAMLRPGEKYDFEVLRDGKRSTMGIKIGSKPEEGEVAADDSNSAPEPEQEGGIFYSKKLGFRFAALDKDARTRYGVPAEQQGLVVTSVSDGSTAAENGMMEGVVLIAYKRQVDRGFVKLDEPKKLLGAVKAMKTGEKIAFKVFFKGRTDFIALKAEE